MVGQNLARTASCESTESSEFGHDRGGGRVKLNLQSSKELCFLCWSPLLMPIFGLCVVVEIMKTQLVSPEFIRSYDSRYIEQYSLLTMLIKPIPFANGVQGVHSRE